MTPRTSAEVRSACRPRPLSVLAPRGRVVVGRVSSSTGYGKDATMAALITDLTDEDIRTVWTGDTATAVADPDGTDGDSDGTDGDSDGTDGDSDGTDA